MDRGRLYFAWLLHTMRDFDAPFLLAHVCNAWMDSQNRAATRPMLAGWCHELSDAILASEVNHPAMQLVSGRTFRADDLRAAMLGLPFIDKRPNGDLCFRPVKDTGDFTDAQARGRHYAALTVKFIRDTRHPSLLAFMALGSRKGVGCRDYRTGFLSVVAEIAAGGDEWGTAHQQAVLPLYRGSVSQNRGGPVSRAI